MSKKIVKKVSLPRHVVVSFSRNNIERYGVKMKFGQTQLRVGSRYVDVDSAVRVSTAFVSVCSVGSGDEIIRVDEEKLQQLEKSNRIIAVYKRWALERQEINIGVYLRDWIGEYIRKQGLKSKKLSEDVTLEERKVPSWFNLEQKESSNSSILHSHLSQLMYRFNRALNYEKEKHNITRTEYISKDALKSWWRNRTYQSKFLRHLKNSILTDLGIGALLFLDASGIIFENHCTRLFCKGSVMENYIRKTFLFPIPEETVPTWIENMEKLIHSSSKVVKFRGSVLQFTCSTKIEVNFTLQIHSVENRHILSVWGQPLNLLSFGWIDPDNIPCDYTKVETTML